MAAWTEYYQQVHLAAYCVRWREFWTFMHANHIILAASLVHHFVLTVNKFHEIFVTVPVVISGNGKVEKRNELLLLYWLVATIKWNEKKGEKKTKRKSSNGRWRFATHDARSVRYRFSRLSHTYIMAASIDQRSPRDPYFQMVYNLQFREFSKTI